MTWHVTTQGPKSLMPKTLAHTYKTINVNKLTPHIGAVIDGVDITKKLRDDQFAEIYHAFLDNSVIFFNNQNFEADNLVEFSRNFGELHQHPIIESHIDSNPYVRLIKTDANSTGANGERWHADVTAEPNPPKASILHIYKLPDVGGDTLFSSMYEAYNTLSDSMKTYLEKLYAVHDGKKVYQGERYPSTEHKIIQVQPETGKKVIFVNRVFTRNIVGIPLEESDAILEFLYRHIENPLWHCRFKWSKNSVAVWDNRCVQHKALWNFYPEVREGHRITVL
jgi:taurine dioxygenase